MKTLTEILPGAETVSADEIEIQYQVTFARGSFWLDLPAGTDPVKPRLIFVFSGRGGVGRQNNLMHAGPASQFRRDKIGRAHD